MIVKASVFLGIVARWVVCCDEAIDLSLSLVNGELSAPNISTCIEYFLLRIVALIVVIVVGLKHGPVH